MARSIDTAGVLRAGSEIVIEDLSMVVTVAGGEGGEGEEERGAPGDEGKASEEEARLRQAALSSRSARSRSSSREVSDAPSRRGSPDSSRSRSRSPEMPKDNKIFVAGLSWEVDNAELERLFGKYGRLDEVKVIFNRDTGRSRGFGFIQYEMSERTAAYDAIHALNNTMLDGRTLTVKRADEPNPRPGLPDARRSGGIRGPRPDSRPPAPGRDRGRDEFRGRDDDRGRALPPNPDDQNKVFVAGFSFEWDTVDLTRAFEKFGTVQDAKVGTGVGVRESQAVYPHLTDCSGAGGCPPRDRAVSWVWICQV